MPQGVGDKVAGRADQGKRGDCRLRLRTSNAQFNPCRLRLTGKHVVNRIDDQVEKIGIRLLEIVLRKLALFLI